VSTRKLGPFELGREIGQGSYGVVYDAVDPVREIRAAIKSFVHAPPGARDALGRLRRDALAAGSLGHPNVASVLAAGEEEGVAWVATEFVSGVSLAQIARSRAHWPIERILDVWRQMCEGLAHAHREGLLHLDLKPTDVRVSTDGDVKVLDFGSWHLKSLEGQRHVFVDSGLRYRPPEVVAGQRPDRRADIFAVGAMVYELVARRRAFPGESTTDVIHSVTRCEPDLATLPTSAFSPGFERLLATSLAREPSRRPASFEEVHADLVQLVRDTAPRLREAAPTTAGARPERDALLTELTRARAEERLEDALEVCRRLLALDPDDEAARRAFPEIESVLVSREADDLVGKALALAADGHIDTAARIAEKVERLAPWSPRYLQLQVYLDEEGARRQAEGHLELARSHLAAGRGEPARAAIEEALLVMPGYEPAEQLLDELALAAAPRPPDPAPSAPVPDRRILQDVPADDGLGEPEEPSAASPPGAPARAAGPAAPPSEPVGVASGEEPASPGPEPDPAPRGAAPGPAAPPSEPVGVASGEEEPASPGPEPDPAPWEPAPEPAEPAVREPAAPPGVEPAGSASEGEAGPPPGPPPAEETASATVSASRRVEAEALTASALRHFMANEHDKARKVVDQALHLDPLNRRARELQRILRVLG
jgi:serine/threonine protein kinase